MVIDKLFGNSYDMIYMDFGWFEDDMIITDNGYGN